MNFKQRIELGMNYLLSNPDAKMGYLPYFGGKIPVGGTPRLEHCYWDYGDGTGRFIESLVYARMASKNKMGKKVEEALN